MTQITLSLQVEDTTEVTEKIIASAVRSLKGTEPIPVGSKVTTENGIVFTVTPSPVGRKGNLADFRAWAEKHGHKVGGRGRVSQTLLAQFQAEQAKKEAANAARAAQRAAKAAQAKLDSE